MLRETAWVLMGLFILETFGYLMQRPQRPMSGAPGGLDYTLVKSNTSHSNPWLNAAYPAYCNYIPVRRVAPKRKSITLACQSRLSGQGAAVSAISVTQRQETMEEKMSGTQPRFDKQSIALQTRRRCWKKRKRPSQRRQCGNRAMAREPRHRSIR